MRINYLCPDELLKKIDARAKELSMSRSAFMNMCLARQLEQEEFMKTIPSMLDTFNRAIDESKRVHK